MTVDNASVKRTPTFANLDPEVGWLVVAMKQGKPRNKQEIWTNAHETRKSL